MTDRLTPDAHLDEAGQVFLRNRVAIERARQRAGAYLGSMWAEVEDRLRATDTEPWGIREMWKDKGDTIGVDFWRPYSPEQAPFSTSKEIQALLRVEDSRAQAVAGDQVRSRVGFWYTDVGRYFHKHHKADLDRLVSTLSGRSDWDVFPHRVAHWYVVDVHWTLGFRRLSDDAEKTAANILAVGDAFAGMLTEVAERR